MGDAVTWVALIAALGASVAFATFWMNFGARVTRAEGEASAAKTRAETLGTTVEQLHGQIATQAAQFALHRETVARDYISREALRETENRITSALDRLGLRIDRALEGKTHA